MKTIFFLFLACLLIVSCGPSPQQQATLTATAQTATAALWTKTFTPTLTFTYTVTPSNTFTPTFTPTHTDTPTNTPTPTLTLTPTDTPTNTRTPTITLSPTFNFPKARVKTEQAPCMYGPSMAFLWKIGLKQGDTGKVVGRSPYPNYDWLYVKMDYYTLYCWIPTEQLDVVGDVNTVIVQDAYIYLAETGYYTLPKWVGAEREGNFVSVDWDPVYMTDDDDRGYLLILNVCQNGDLTWVIKNVTPWTATSFTVEDDTNCSQYSSGVLYTVEKHGYIGPYIIRWP